MMKMVQKIETGGTSKTRTPMLKFRINELFEPIDARHMTHWAEAESETSKHRMAATNRIEKMRRTFMRLTALSPAKAGSRNPSLMIPALKRWAILKPTAARTKTRKLLGAFRRRWRSAVPQVLRAKTVGEE